MDRPNIIYINVSIFFASVFPIRSLDGREESQYQGKWGDANLKNWQEAGTLSDPI